MSVRSAAPRGVPARPSHTAQRRECPRTQSRQDFCRAAAHFGETSQSRGKVLGLTLPSVTLPFKFRINCQQSPVKTLEQAPRGIGSDLVGPPARPVRLTRYRVRGATATERFLRGRHAVRVGNPLYPPTRPGLTWRAECRGILAARSRRDATSREKHPPPGGSKTDPLGKTPSVTDALVLGFQSFSTLALAGNRTVDPRFPRHFSLVALGH